MLALREESFCTALCSSIPCSELWCQDRPMPAFHAVKWGAQLAELAGCHTNAATTHRSPIGA